jgi:hypothetical protein
LSSSFSFLGRFVRTGWNCERGQCQAASGGVRQEVLLAIIFTLLAFFAFELQADSSFITETMTPRFGSP